MKLVYLEPHFHGELVGDTLVSWPCHGGEGCSRDNPPEDGPTLEVVEFDREMKTMTVRTK